MINSTDTDDDSTNTDDDRLPLHVRYKDLVEAGIVNSWSHLLSLIDNEGFPPGQMMSPNIRTWRLNVVKSWLDGRPTARKVPPPLKPGSRRGRPRKTVAAEAAT